MQILICSDLHITAVNPIGRKDNYAYACLRKLKQLVDYSNTALAPIVISGDVFHKPQNPTWLENSVSDILLEAKSGVFGIPGNHDLPYHSYTNKSDCSFYSLELAGAIKQPTTVKFDESVCVHLLPFGELEPAATSTEANYYNVLVCHIPVFATTVPHFMPEAYTIDEVEKMYPLYEQIICGDVHITAIKSKTIVTGSMMRMTRAQKEHKPCFVELDTDTGEKTIHYFQIEEEVWKTDFVAEVEDGFSEGLQELSEVLVARGEKLSYKDTVTTLAGNEEIKLKFMKIMEGYKND